MLAEQFRAAGVDCLVAIGGGRVIDSAKGAAVAMVSGAPLHTYFTDSTPPAPGLPPSVPPCGPPVVAIPTTLAGAEVTPSAGFAAADGSKRLVRGLALLPAIACADPNVLVHTSRALLTSTGMTALAHCVEALYAPDATPFSSALALEGTALLGRGLGALARGDLPATMATADLGAGSALAGLAIGHTRSSLQHAIAQVLASRCGIAHGDAHSVMLPIVLRFNADATSAAQARFACALQSAFFGERAKRLTLAPWETVAEVRSAIDAPASLADLGVDEAALDAVAVLATAQAGFHANPRHITDAAEVRMLLEQAL
jgi:alcohol dehydrogenase class IV